MNSHYRSHRHYSQSPVYTNPKAGPIGFLMSGPNQSVPSQARPPQFPYGPNPSQPFPNQPWGGSQFPPPNSPGPIPPPGGSLPGQLPSVSAPSNWQGMLQGLTSSLGSIDFPNLISNAQKWIGMFNQLGSVLKQAAPLLQLVQGLNEGLSGIDDEPLTELSDDEITSKEPKKKRKRTSNVKSKTGSKKRSYKKRAR